MGASRRICSRICSHVVLHLIRVRIARGEPEKRPHTPSTTAEEAVGSPAQGPYVHGNPEPGPTMTGQVLQGQGQVYENTGPGPSLICRNISLPESYRLGICTACRLSCESRGFYISLPGSESRGELILVTPGPLAQVAHSVFD